MANRGRPAREGARRFIFGRCRRADGLAAVVFALRAIAVMLVLNYHGFPEAMPGGFIGVDVFFVISGFLITGIIARELGQQRFSLLSFYHRRVRRIFPALIVVLSAA